MTSGLPRMVAVIGAGQMGCGIAELFAQKGFLTLLSDINPTALSNGLHCLVLLTLDIWRRRRLLGQKRIERSLLKVETLSDLEKRECIERITFSTDLTKIKETDLIIEAVTEKEEIKREVLSKCADQAHSHALICSNTSSISITRLSQALKTEYQASAFVGLHFMNPPPVMKLVEIIRGMKTSDQTYEYAKHVCTTLDKIVCTSADRPGFIVNRILMPMINEAFFALMECVATADEIDAGMKYGTNQPMGPLALADFIGLDVCLSIITVLHASLGEDKYRPCPLLRQYVDAGRLGRKEGVLHSEANPSQNEIRLAEALKARSFSFARFVRVPADYYDRDLNYRRQCLGAESCEQLCKTMVMENTKWTPPESPTNARYIMVILQYEKDRVHAEKMRSFMHNLNNKSIPRKNFNLRLAPEDASSELTGFEHNAVTPIGAKTTMPIVVSHEIAAMNVRTFYIGAGEVDLKLEIYTTEFAEKYNAHIVDCTY